MADLRLQISSDSRRAQQDIDRLRREIQTLRTQLGQTGGASNTASEAVDRLGDESAQTARQVRNLGEAQGRATGGTQTFTRSLGGLGTVLGGLGIAAAGAAVLGLGANATRAAIQVESATNSFAALGLGVAGAEERVMQLIELSQNPGISFPQAIQAATRLETVGISGLRADAVIREFGNSLALVGSTDLSGILLGLTQIVSAGKVTTEEIRQITERSGLAAQAIRQEFSSLIGDDIQNSLEEAGQGVQDFVDRLVNRLSTQGRAAVDSTQNSFQNLQNSVFLLSAEIGGRFTPALGAAARGVSSFIDGITEAIQSSERFAEVLARVNAEITAASGQIELRAAIESGREALEAFIRQSEAAIRNNSVFFGGREDAILTGQINQAREALAEFVGIQEQQIETEAELRAELALQEAELERIQNAQTERNNLIAEQGISARNASRIYLENLEQEDIATNASIDELEAKLAAYEAVGTAAEESTGTATEGTDTATESTKELVTEVQRLTEIYNGLTQHIQEANELFDFIAQANTPEFYRLVRSELEAYGGAVDTVIPSVINLKNELEALTAAFDANLQVLDPESDVIDNLVRGVTDLSTPLTDASDETQALAQELRDLIHQANIAQSISEPFEVLREDINLVNPAISAAAETMENYITVMGAVQGEFQTIDTLSDRLTAAIRDQASAFDDLATSAGRASQGVGSGVFDQFSGRTPGTASGITGDNALDLEGIIGGIQGIGLDFLREGAALQLENAAEIDTVTESLAVFGDVAARLAAGDLTALGTAVTRTFGIINDTNEAFAERRRLRGIEANEEHLSRAGRFRNLQRVADITGVDINSDDLGGFRQNLASGLTGFTALFSTEFEDAINAANLSEGVGQALFQLVADIDRELTSEDIQRAIATFHEPIISSLENLAGQAAFNLDFASQTGGDVQGALQEVISANTALTQAQIDAANEQRRATGTSVENVEELNRVLNALNNQSRLQLDALPPNVFTIASRRRAAQSTAERTGTDRQATEDVARAQYGDAVYDAEVAAAELDPAIAQLASFSADDTFSNNVEAFRMSVNAAGQTIEGINAAIGSFTENVLRPEFERLRGLILDDDGIISAAEELELRQAGVFNFEDFSAPFLQLGEDAISGIQATESALANYVDESGFSDNVTAFRMSINAAGLTVADINSAWGLFVENTLRPEFERLRGLILDDDGIISAAEELALREAGVFTFEDFTGQFTGIRDAAVMGVETTQRALANYVAESGFQENVSAFRMSINAAGTTVADVNTAWDAFVENALRPEFERLRGLILDDDGVISAAEELSLREAGLFTFGDFTSGFMGIRDAAIMGIQTAAAALANYIAESEFESNVNTFRTSLSAAGTTIEDINAAWEMFIENTLRPEFERLRSLILDDDGIITAVEELSLRRAGVFTFEDFTSGFIGIRDAAVTVLTTAQTARASRAAQTTQANAQRAQDAAKRAREAIEASEVALEDYIATSGFEANVEAFRNSISTIINTVADVNTAWDTFVENTLRPEFERIRGLLLDNDGVISAAEELSLRQQGVFTFEDFTGQFTGIKDAAISGIETAASALANYVSASGFEGNVEAFRTSLNAAGITIEDINTAWSAFVENALRPEFERLRGLILDDDGIIDAAEEVALRQAGIFTFEDFTGRFVGIKDAAVMGIQTAEAALANYVDESGFEGNVTVFRTSLNAAGLTIEDVNSAWGEFVENTLRPEFERLRGLILDDDGVISAAEELALRRAGLYTFEDFTSGFIGIKDTAVMGIETAASALANYVSETGFSDNVEAFRTSISAIGTTVEDVNTAWNAFVENTLRPEFERIRGLILDDDGIISVAEELALRRAGVFTFEDFTGGFTGIRDTAISGVENAAQALASRQSSNARRGDRFNVRQARFNLGGTTSEQEFDDLFGILSTAINTFYDNEEARIQALGLGIEETTRLLAENNQARREEFRGLSNITNTFAEDRLRTEMRTQDAIKDLRDDALENEADRLESLADLAEDHQQRLTDIERDGLRRREDLQRELSRDFADNFREEQEQIAELLSGEGFDTREIQRFLQGFEGDVRGRLGEDALSQLNEIQREGAVESIDLRRERDRDLEDIGIREGRQVEDAERRLARSEEEVNAQAQATAAALTTALAPLLGMQAMLTQQQQDTAVLENVTATNTAATAATQVRTAMKEETNAAMTAATARVESNTAARRSAIAAMEARLQEQTATNIERFGMGIERFGEIPDLFSEVGERLTMSADRLDFSADALTQSAELWATALGRDIELLTPAERPDFAAQDAVSLQPDIDAALAMAASPEAVALSADIVNVTGGTVNVSGDVAGGVRPQTPTRPIEVTIQHNQPVQIDGQTLGRIVDEVLVRLDTNGGTVGSYVRRDT